MQINFLSMKVLILFLSAFCITVLGQTSSEHVQTGLEKYNSGDYQSALTSFNSALQNVQTEKSEPLVSDSEEKYVTESEETDVSVNKESYVGTQKESYVGVSKESMVGVETEKYISEPLKHQGEDESSIYLYRGMSNLKLGNNEEALADFDTAIELNPSSADAYFKRALLNHRVDPEKACPDLVTAIGHGHKSALELHKLICE